MLRTPWNVIAKWLPAKRFRAPLLVLAGVVPLLSGCGDDADRPSEEPAGKRARAAIDLPRSPPDAAGRISFYMELLRRGDRDDVVWTTAELARAGEAAVPALAETLEGAGVKNAILAESILSVLAEQVDGSSAIETIVAAAKARDGRVRILAARALGRTGDPDAVAPLLDLACDPSPDVARTAVVALGRIGGEQVARGLLGRFWDGLSRDARPAAVEVVAAGLPAEAARRFLLELAEGDDPSLAVAAGAALASRGEVAGAETLGRMLPDLEGPIRWVALQALAAVEDERALAELLEAAASESPPRQAAAASLLGAYDDPRAKAALAELSRARSLEVRREAFHSLFRTGAPEALREVRKLLRSSDSDDRLLAAQLLGQWKDPATVPELVRSADLEERPRVRLLLARALALIGRPEGAVAVLRVMLSEADDAASQEFLAFNAAAILAMFESLPEDVLEELHAATRSESVPQRLNAAKVLGAVEKGPRAREAVARLLVDPDPDVRRTATRLWQGLPGADVETLVRAHASEPDDDVASEMASAAARLSFAWK